MPNEFPDRIVAGVKWLRSPSRICATHLSGSAAEIGGRARRAPWADLTRFYSAAGYDFASSSLAASRPRKAEESERLAGAVTGLAGIAALAIALAFPAAYLLSAHNRLMGIIEVRAQIYGDRVTDTASQNP